jgi:hypothetical protein
MDFAAAERMFRGDQIRELSESRAGLRFLKLRSLSRKDYLEQLHGAVGSSTGGSARDMLKSAFTSSKITDAVIDKTIRDIFASERSLRKSREPALVSELYKMHAFDWGGLHQNSLEKTIVDNYVKRITDYDTLNTKVDNELLASMRGYVLCSWYNHWTSIIIEDIFRDHPKVLPAIGQVKKVDFFLNEVPFDLKVTYLPEGYIKDKRRADGLRPELTLLKQAARSRSVAFDRDASDSQILEDLWRKIADHPATECADLIRQLRDYRLSLVDDCKRNPRELIRWLYENQGVRRFDASNRLFLVLIDTSDFFASWRLKRAKPLLDATIAAYLDSVPARPGHKLTFTWESTKYSAVSDAVVVVHGS